MAVMNHLTFVEPYAVDHSNFSLYGYGFGLYGSFDPGCFRKKFPPVKKLMISGKMCD
jgi:hypothetical protein